jgi:hypothetical protein
MCTQNMSRMVFGHELTAEPALAGTRLGLRLSVPVVMSGPQHRTWKLR